MNRRSVAAARQSAAGIDQRSVRRSSKKLLLRVVVAQAVRGHRKRQRTAAVQKLARLRSGLAHAKRLGLRQSSAALGARATFQEAVVSSTGNLLEESVGASKKLLLQVVVAQAVRGHRKRQRTGALQKLAHRRSGLANAKRLGLRQSSAAL